MYHHIVLLRLRGLDEDFHVRVAECVAQLRAELPFVRSYDFVRNKSRHASGYEWAVISSFDTQEDRDRYQISQAHRKIEEFMKPYIDDLIVCDAAVGAQP
ncbi:MAG: Dabb family protein [Xanthobacteraceae bacterium]|nr:Dabb family protein [Xanthobacteraceae bacterium]